MRYSNSPVQAADIKTMAHPWYRQRVITVR